MHEAVVIAGAGMGGLSAAIALGLLGQQTLLCERSSVFKELGAGVQLGPNATRVLQSWGMLQGLKDYAAWPTHIEVFHGHQATALARLDLGSAFVRRYEAPYLTLHRADLQTCLVERLKSVGQTDLRMGSALVGFHQGGEGVDVEWEGQRSEIHQMPLTSHELKALEDSVTNSSFATNAWTTHAQALIGADGVSSQVRRLCWPERHLQATKHLAYRTTIAQKLLPLKLRQTGVRVYLGPHMHWVQYPIRGGEWLNIVALIEVPTYAAKRAPSAQEPLYQTWQESVSMEDTREHFNRALLGAHADMQELFRAVDAWSAWRLFDAEPLSGPQQMVRGSVALLGDAAHPMLPFLAQGAGMSIEDAQGLAKFWGHAHRPVQDRLSAYAQERWQRNARVQLRARTNARIFHATGWLAHARDLSLRLLGQRLLDMPWLYDGPSPSGAHSI